MINVKYFYVGFKVESIHEKSDPVTAINDCKGILVGRF